MPLARRVICATICHLLTTSKLTSPFLHEYDIQIKLLSENKLIIWAFGNLHYQTARGRFEGELAVEPG
jgi:hypothetical protein